MMVVPGAVAMVYLVRRLIVTFADFQTVNEVALNLKDGDFPCSTTPRLVTGDWRRKRSGKSCLQVGFR